MFLNPTWDMCNHTRNNVISLNHRGPTENPSKEPIIRVLIRATHRNNPRAGGSSKKTAAMNLEQMDKWSVFCKSFLLGEGRASELHSIAIVLFRAMSALPSHNPQKIAMCTFIKPQGNRLILKKLEKIHQSIRADVSDSYSGKESGWNWGVESRRSLWGFLNLFLCKLYQNSFVSGHQPFDCYDEFTKCFTIWWWKSARSFHDRKAHSQSQVQHILYFLIFQMLSTHW